MPVTVVPIRKRGVPINPLMREAGAFTGDLSMCEYLDPVLRRYVKRVDLLGKNIGQGAREHLLPSLLDATLVTLGNDRIMLTGFERLPVAGEKVADFAQSWWVQLRS